MGVRAMECHQERRVAREGKPWMGAGSGSKVERWAAGEAPGTVLRPTMMNYFDGNNQDEMLMRVCQGMDTQPDNVLLLGLKWNRSLSFSLWEMKFYLLICVVMCIP